MEKKQTAVEWLVNELNNRNWNTDFYKSDIKVLINQAKEMEKEQIIDAYKEGNHSEMRGGKVIFEKMEQYYNETFKSE